MDKPPRRPGHNVVEIATRKSNSRHKAAQDHPAGQPIGVPIRAGSANDPRMKEALRLAEAFLAIEDDIARSALIILAEQLVTLDWVRKLQGRRNGLSGRGGS